MAGLFDYELKFKQLPPKCNSIHYETYQGKGAELIIYESTLENGTSFFDILVVNNLGEVKQKSKVIIANCFNECLSDVKKKVYTCDIFCRN